MAEIDRSLTQAHISAKETALVIKDERFTGLERIVLTSDGNLQRTMSAYYNDVVVLELCKFERIGNYESNTFTREVILKCKSKIFCNARTQLLVTNNHVLSLLEEKGMGLGQLFAFLKAQPVFTLLDCGKDDKKLWRHYRLEIPGLVCIITEVFPANLFTIDFTSKEDEFTPEIWETVAPLCNRINFVV